MPVLAEVFAAMLEAEGVRHLFGYPGGATVELAERARQAGLDFLAAKSEWSAGYMACMYGDLEGRPGVLLATLGPGAANAVNATANATLDRTPLLTITGATGLGAGAHSHQRFNQVSLYEPVTKWSASIAAPSFPRVLHRAVRVAVAERPGAVHLDLPQDQVLADCPEPDLEPVCATEVAYGVSAGVEKAARRMASARRPLLLAGAGARRRSAGAALARCAEAWGMPVVTTPKGKGVLPESHPCWAGVVEMASPRLMEEFVSRSDLLVCAGFDAVELIRHWKQTAPAISIDVLPNTDETFVSELDLVGEIGLTLEALAARAPGPGRWEEREIAEHRRNYVDRSVRTGSRLTPSQVVFTARSLLSPDAIVISDVGSHKMLLGGLWPVEQAGTFFMSNGLGTMGFSLPAGVAASLLRPSQRVVSFLGDGGFAMVGAELGTARDRGLPLVAVVFNDGSLDRILRKQEAEGHPALGTTFSNPDFARLAESYGVAGFRAETEAEFRSAFEQALGCGGPALVDARIDPEEYRVQFAS